MRNYRFGRRTPLVSNNHPFDLVIYFLIFVGFGLSAYVSYLYLTKSLPIYTIGALFDCGFVLRSPYLAVFGIPMSVIGIVFFILLFRSFQTAHQSSQVESKYSLFFLTAFGFVVSVYFLVVQAIILRIFCSQILMSMLILVALYVYVRKNFQTEHRQFREFKKQKIVEFLNRKKGPPKRSKLLAILMLFCIFHFFSTPIFGQSQTNSSQNYYKAKILSITPADQYFLVKIRFTDQSNKVKEMVLPQVNEDQLRRQNIQSGDTVYIALMKGPNNQSTAYIADHDRSISLLILFSIFLAIVLWIGRRKGLLSLVAMAISFMIIAGFIVPQIMIGNDPLIISLLGSLFIIPLTFYISHGVQLKTSIAVAGTFIALALTGSLAYFFVYLTKLTGFSAEEAVFLQFLKSTIDIRNLLLAGIVIGAMGVLDDITISQTAIVEKLIKANPRYSRKELFTHAMDIGRDHIASLVNTLILVYTGAALPLFLLFSQSQDDYWQIFSQEIVATEIVRTLVSSIGIICAVPVTTFIATVYLKKNGV